MRAKAFEGTDVHIHLEERLLLERIPAPMREHATVAMLRDTLTQLSRA